MTEEVRNLNEVPVPESKRKRTDFFMTLCSSAFALIIFIISIACLNSNNLGKMTFPADGEGNLCGWDVPQYPLLYYTSLTDPTKRLCVKECPKEGDTQLSCFSTKSLSCSKNDNPKYEVQIYDSHLQNNRVGLFCWPVDENSKQQLLQKSGLNQKYVFLAFYDAMWNSLWLTTIFGIIYIALVQFFPRKVVPWSILLGGIFFIILGLLTIIVPSGFIVLRIVLGIFFIFLGVLGVYSLWNDEYRKAIILCSRLVECSTQVLKYDYKLLIFIPVFMILFIGLIFLTAFQILGVWSVGQLSFDQSYPFYDIKGFASGFFTFLIFLQFFWGMSFLKQSFNFCVAGYATNWYFYRETKEDQISLLKSPKLLLKYHWGSIAGGSLLLFLFYFMDLSIDFFWGSDRDVQKRIIPKETFRRQMVEYGQQKKKRNICASFFNLVRSQAFGYINVIPLPYCNASRYSEYMADQSSFYDRSQTINRLFRLGAHSVIIFIVSMISIGTMKGSSGQTSIYGIGFIIVISLFTITYFVSFHGDLAEGILISIFIEEKLSDDSEELAIPPEIVKKVYSDDIGNNLQRENTIREVLI